MRASRALRPPETTFIFIHMKTIAKILLTGLLISASPGHLNAQVPTTPAEALQAEIEALKVPRVAWRGIAWKSCLIEGLKESREKQKPVLLWIFIDRPVDDARC